MSAVINRVQSLLTHKYATDAQRFYAYRRLMHADFVHGWFPWDLSNHLEFQSTPPPPFQARELKSVKNKIVGIKRFQSTPAFSGEGITR